MGFFLFIFTIANIILAMKNIFVFIDVFRHKKHYFVRLGFGGIFKKRMFYFTLGIIRRKNMPKYLILLRKKGRIKKLAQLDKPMKKPDPDLIKIIFCETRIKNISLKFLMGLETAAVTAILGEILMLAIENLFGVYKSNYKKCEMNYDIKLSFEKPQFTINANCILKFDIANIIFRYIFKKLKKVVLDYGKHRKRYAGNNERNKENCGC